MYLQVNDKITHFVGHDIGAAVLRDVCCTAVKIYITSFRRGHDLFR